MHHRHDTTGLQHFAAHEHGSASEGIILLIVVADFGIDVAGVL